MKIPASFVFFCFFPLTIGLYQLCCRVVPRFAAFYLLICSIVFYAMEDLRHLPLLLVSMVVNFWFTGRILHDVARRRMWVTVGVLLNLFPLFLYKYGLHASASDGMNGETVLAGIPLGLSFYTFTQITSLFDIQRRGAVRLPFFRHALFAGLFAQIPAGPVSRYRDLAPQIAKLGSPVPLSAVLAGSSLIIIGLTKKLLFADQLGHFVDIVHAYAANGRQPTIAEVWLSAWTYLLQLYFDFSGYSDIAIGLGISFGLKLPINFNSPLKARSGSEFIDRWHMSLVAWVREYLYEPVFEFARKLPLRAADNRRIAAWAVATIASMAVLGAWHGNSLPLIVGGTISGVLLVLAKLPKIIGVGRGRPSAGARMHPVRSFLHRVILLGLLSVLGLFTRAQNRSTLRLFLHALVDMRSGWGSGGSLAEHIGRQLSHFGSWQTAVAAVVGSSLIVWCFPNTMQIFGLLPESQPHNSRLQMRWRPGVRWGIAMGGLLALILLLPTESGGGFLYGRF